MIFRIKLNSLCELFSELLLATLSSLIKFWNLHSFVEFLCGEQLVAFVFEGSCHDGSLVVRVEVMVFTIVQAEW